MPANLDDTIGKIVDRAQLLEWVTALPEDVKGVIIVDVDPKGKENPGMMLMKVREIGGINLADSVYLIMSYLHKYIFRSTWS